MKFLTPREGQWSDLRSNRFAGGGLKGWRTSTKGWVNQRNLMGNMWDEWRFHGNLRVFWGRNWELGLNQLSFLLFSWTFPRVLLVFADHFDSMEVQMEIATHQGEKATRCHVCSSVGDSWKVQIFTSGPKWLHIEMVPFSCKFTPRWFGQCCNS